MTKVINNGITYVGSYWDAKDFDLIDADGNVIASLPMTQFHNAIEAYEEAFTKVVYK